MNNTYTITVNFHKLIEDWEWGKSLRFSSQEIRNFLVQNHLRSHNVSWHCIRQEIAPKGKVNGHSSRHALIGLFGHCPEAKTSWQCRIQSTDLKCVGKHSIFWDVIFFCVKSATLWQVSPRFLSGSERDLSATCTNIFNMMEDVDRLEIWN